MIGVVDVRALRCDRSMGLGSDSDGEPPGMQHASRTERVVIMELGGIA